ncbi:hypothetical protein [Brumimicrobium oceani]|nr:hypothetical protein [Brumimicrobium oceani]
MNNFSKVLYVIIGSVFLSSCGSAVNAPVKTIEDQKASLHKTIEETAKANHVLEDYQSLSFGQMKVYKPETFVRLDSIYAIKQNYIEENDLRGLRSSGIEELIPIYREEALLELDQVQYEIEHIYQTGTGDSIQIHSSFFLFDHKDSLVLISPFYHFKIAPKFKDLFYAYQFDYHFVTNRNLYISEAEWDFIRFFKTRQFELTGTSALEAFMQHTMRVMEAARKSATVDFRNLSKLLVTDHFKTLGKEIMIEKFGKLMVIEENNIVMNYELKVDWIDETMEGMNKSTVFKFSPYLEIEDIKTNIPQ